MVLGYYNNIFADTDTNASTSETQRLLIENAKRKCYARMSKEPPSFSSGLWCNRTWDDIMCWDDAPASTIVKQQCPHYIHGFAKMHFAYKKCTSNGTWYENEQTNKSWTDYSSCIDKQTKKIFKDLLHMQEDLKRVSAIVNFGYGLSLIALIAAIMILIFCRRSNYKSTIIHINLFLAFLIRSLFALLRQNLFTHGVAMDIDVETKNAEVIFKSGSHWECRSLYTLFVYGIAVSQSWIFMEGVHLQMLFYRTLLTQLRGIKIYVISGWCLPITYIIPWAILRVKYDNFYCWSFVRKTRYEWIIRAPIIIVTAINFLFFINNLRMLFRRTQARTKNRAIRKLAKFIVMLVPLFGIPNVLFMFNTPTFNANIDRPFLYTSVTYSSLQGAILSFLYCFLHDEVRLAIRQSCKRMLRRKRINHSIASYENRCLSNLRRESFGSAPRTPSTNVSEVNGGFHNNELPADQDSLRRVKSSPATGVKIFRSARKNPASRINNVSISQLPYTDLNRDDHHGSYGEKLVTVESELKKLSNEENM